MRQRINKGIIGPQTYIGGLNTIADINLLSITGYTVTDSSYNNLDDTAVGTTGGYIKITGTGFSSGITVYINGSVVSSTYVNPGEIRAVVPTLAAGTYTIWVFKGSISAAFVSLVTSGFPSWTSTSYTSTSLTVSVQLLATGDGTLTYSLYSGTLPSGLSLSSTGLISGTVSADSTTTDLIFLVNDSQNQTTQQTVTLTISTADPYWKHTTGLLQGDVVPFISDASTNAFTVTPVGDTRPYNFNPYTPGYYSNYFDGTGDYFDVAGGASLNSTGDFTLEAWAFITSSSTYQGIVSLSTSANAYGGRINVTNAGYIDYSISPGGSYASTLCPINQWFHVALVRSGSATNNCSCYLNGTRVAQFTSTSQVNTASNLTVGRYYADSAAYYTSGYVSNVRYVIGSASYSGATMTVPTTPLTAVSGTAVLTCQSNRLIDNSTNAFTITKYGDTSVKPNHPFTPNSSYAAYGSAYFDGTGDRITVSNSTINVGANPFTIEFWFYCADVTYSDQGSGQQVLFSNYGNSTTGLSIQLYLQKINVNMSGDGFDISGTTTIVSNQWYHAALSGSSGSMKLFLNGVQEGSTYTGSNSSIATGLSLYIGVLPYSPSPIAYYKGYISNLRVVLGTAVYTAAFTPPTSPLTAISGTSLLTLQTNLPHNNNIVLDNSTNDFAVTRSGSPIQGTFSPYSGYYSNYFDGTGDYLSVAANAAFAFGTGDFTVEGWIYFNSTSPSISALCQSDAVGTSTNDKWWFGYSGALYFNTHGSGGFSVSIPWTATVGRWYHIAATRSSGTVSLFVDGVKGSNTVTGTPSGYSLSQNGLVIGAISTPYYTNAYISNVRIVKGTALYTATFTPSTTLLTAVSGTSILTCQSNRLIDNSTNSFAITKNGDVTVKPFSPFGRTSEYSIASNGGSIYYDGSSYTSFGSNSLFAFGTNDFTVEAWVYFTSLGPGFNIFNIGGASAGSYSLYYISPGKVQTARYGDTAGSGTTTQTFALNTWYHIAAVRSSGTAKIYVNGIADSGATYATMGTITATAAESGGRIWQAAYTGTGYISNLRVFPRTAQYTTDFTPPTAPVVAIQNTGLLIDGTSGAVIGGTQQHNITTVADTRVLNTQYKYASGSYYFDGTGDYMLTTPSTELEFGAGDFTIEMWWYPTSTARQALYCGSFGTDYSVGIDYSSTVGNQKIGVWASSTGSSWNLVNADFGGNGVGTVTVNQNAWNHIAFVRYGTTWMSFVNGTRDCNITGLSGTIVDRSTAQKAIGSWFSTASMAQVTGYIDDFRITKGYARYVANFTVPSLVFKAR